MVQSRLENLRGWEQVSVQEQKLEKLVGHLGGGPLNREEPAQ